MMAATILVSACSGPVRLTNGIGPETLQQAVFSLREKHPVALATRLVHPDDALGELAASLRDEHESGAPPSQALQRDVVDTLARLDPEWFQSPDHLAIGSGVHVDLRVDPAFRWTADRLVSLEIADRRRIEGLRDRHRREGIGVPMVARIAVGDADPLRAWSPENGFLLPVTAVATPGTDNHALVVTLHDPRARGSIAIGSDQRSVPLAADFTAPFAFYAAEHADFANRRVFGVFRPEVLADQEGLHLIEPYDPDRIPLLLVHGFASSPLTWLDLNNDVLGNDRLRGRFQVWHYHYPTGVSWLAAAADFRRALSAFRERLPEAGGPPPDDWVVVAHSMGGLLAKTLVTTSNGELWEAADNRPIDSLALDDEDRAALHEMFEFEPVPSVGRVVFVASPLNGSGLAGAPYARLGARLARTPERLASLVDRTARAVGRDHEDFAFDKVTLLGEEEPITSAFAALPIERPFHLVLGRKFPLPGGRFTDGVVSSDAARVDGAESELVVATETHNVHHKPAALAEILRILREHGAAGPTMQATARAASATTGQ